MSPCDHVNACSVHGLQALFAFLSESPGPGVGGNGILDSLIIPLVRAVSEYRICLTVSL